MPEPLAAALGAPGLVWLVSLVLLAGLVRGFTGFGTALVYLPVAARWLSPFEAITTLAVMELIGPLPNIPQAVRECDKGDVLRLGLGMVLALPLGVAMLVRVPAEVFRYGLSLSALVLVGLLAAGVALRGPLHRSLIWGAGALSGLMAGAVGLPGPPVIMLYMAAPRPLSAIRASLLLFLFLSDVAMLCVYWIFGHLVFGAVALGLLLALPYLIGNMLGARLFHPKAAKAYRRVAYGVIVLSALRGLPALG